MAGLGAGAGALIVGLQTEVPRTEAGWIALIGSALAAGVVTGLATWRVPNKRSGS